MTLQLIPYEFPYTVYEENFVFFFISAPSFSRQLGKACSARFLHKENKDKERDKEGRHIGRQSQ
jgi:hypothetical protein